MNLTVSNAQIPLNKLNKSKGILIRNLFRKGKIINNAEEKENGLRKNEEIEYPKQRKNNIVNNIKLNNIIFNLMCYGE